jgi:predicted amidohydrolase
MKIGYIQTSPLFGDKDANLSQADELMKGIRADLLVLPELFSTGYAFQSKEELSDLAEETNGPTCRFLMQRSLDTGAVIVAGFAEKDGGSFYNSSVMVFAGKVTGVYRKLHLFNREKLFFTPGNYPLKVFEINGARIGMMICFDWIFPEACRVLALEGAQVIAHPANLVLPWCQQAMTVRCLENRVFAVTANRTGAEKRGADDLVFTGASQVTSCDGTILSSASADSACTGLVETDPALAGRKLVNDFNDVIADRRPEFYRPLTNPEITRK